MPTVVRSSLLRERDGTSRSCARGTAMSMTRRQFVGGVTIATLVSTGGAATEARGPDSGGVPRFRPYNVVVIILDTSESFQRPSREPGVLGKVLFVEALGVVH